MDTIFTKVELHKIEKNVYKNKTKRRPGRPKKGETLKRNIKEQLFNLQLLNFKKRIKNIVSSMYTRDNYWIDTSEPWNITVTIRYPEIMITNSRGEKHKIKDLFVKVFIKYSIVEVSRPISGYSVIITNCDIYGTRSTIDVAEIKVGYVHSHLPESTLELIGDNPIIGFGTFCLGTGELRFQTRDMCNRYTKFLKAADTTSLEELFLYLNEYVKWESLEGVPYISIGKLPLGEEVYLESSKMLKMQKDVLNKMRTKFSSKALSQLIIVKHTPYSIDLSINMELLTRVINSLQAEEDKYVVVRGKAYNEESIKSMDKDVKRYNSAIEKEGTCIRIKDDDLGVVTFPTIVEYNKEEALASIKTRTKSPHPDLVIRISNEIISRLKKKIQ